MAERPPGHTPAERPADYHIDISQCYPSAGTLHRVFTSEFCRNPLRKYSAGLDAWPPWGRVHGVSPSQVQ